MKLFGSKKQADNTNTLKIFAGIDASIVEEILAASPRAEYGSGEMIMEQGEHPDGKGYIIEEGSVNVWVDGNSTAELSEGDIFGEIALLNEEPRSASVVSKTPTKVIVLSQDILFQMIENDDNSINKEIMRRMEENLENEE